jgi:hypothetical protein
MMMVERLCGKPMYMRRSRKEEDTFKSMDGRWTGVLEDDVYTMTREDGWKMVFRQGLISEMSTDKGRKFEWSATDASTSAFANKVSH